MSNKLKLQDLKERRLVRGLGLTILDVLFIGVWFYIYTYLKESYWFLIYENKPFISFLTVFVLLILFLIEVFINYKIIASIKNLSHIRQQEAEMLERQRQEASEMERLRERFFDSEAEMEYNFADFTKLFQNVAIEKPQLHQLMEQAVNQMNLFQEDKVRLKTVMKLQKIDYPVITNCIESTEDGLLKTMKSLLVDISVYNPTQLQNEDRRDSYVEIYDSIEKKLELNKRNLNNFNELVMRARTIKDQDIKEDYEIIALIKALDVKSGGSK